MLYGPKKSLNDPLTIPLPTSLLIFRMEDQEGHLCLKGHFPREVMAERILEKGTVYGSHRQQIHVLLSRFCR